DLAPGVAPADALETGVTLERMDLRARVDRDAWAVLDAAHEIARHGLGQTVRAHQDVDVPGGLGEEDRRLAGGVASAHHDHLLAPLLARAEPGFHLRRGVVPPRALEHRQPR